jgi:hypothetical protein
VTTRRQEFRRNRINSFRTQIRLIRRFSPGVLGQTYPGDNELQSGTFQPANGTGRTQFWAVSGGPSIVPSVAPSLISFLSWFRISPVVKIYSHGQNRGGRGGVGTCRKQTSDIVACATGRAEVNPYKTFFPSSLTVS